MKHFTCWNQLLVMMFGQLADCDSLREVAAIIDAIKSKSYHLGSGSGDIKLSNLSYANANRDYNKIFEEHAYHMIKLAPKFYWTLLTIFNKILPLIRCLLFSYVAKASLTLFNG